MIDGGDGDDYCHLRRLGRFDCRWGGTDSLIVDLDTAATIDLSSADQTSGDTANVTGFENVYAWVVERGRQHHRRCQRQ